MSTEHTPLGQSAPHPATPFPSAPGTKVPVLSLVPKRQQVIGPHYHLLLFLADLLHSPFGLFKGHLGGGEATHETGTVGSHEPREQTLS